ncbi:MAG TPA: antibiotic ABC transporter ATP-binding protein [Cryomorphaceae bacterium]|nr:antibiotic ABC transporter ATP-binding protein [Cryomorphaceae bacterium]HCY25553.1 antibiotic ABC transporter ATP-binding protein [Cryomorphaceae bacterium]|tara:strand:+ start:4758 stop:6518 length:1761 start_codon:yes stop_codon:yes gene_type:complete
MSKVGGKAFDFKLFLKVLGYAKPYQRLFTFSMILTVLLGALGTARPILIRQVIDDAILGYDAPMLLKLTFMLVGLLVIESIGQFGFMYAANWLGQSIIKDIRVELYDKLQTFRLQFYDKTPIGQLVTRVVSDIETISQIFSQGILVIFGDLFRILVMLGAMFFFFHPILVLVSLSIIPVLFIATRWFQRGIKGAFQRVRNEVSNLNTFVQEHLGGMSIVQAFGREEQEFDKFKTINDRHRNANVESIFYYALFFPIIEVLSAISIGLAVWYGGMNAAVGGSVTVGELTAMIIFIGMLFRPLRQLADRFNTLQMGMVASERVLNLLDSNHEVEPNGDIRLGKLEGDIVFDQVYFHYKENEPILKEVSFSVAPGETVAIVGATGAGKSTIISVLMGFYPYTKGSVQIDGNELTSLDLHTLRQQMALVLQDVFLFSDTVRSNIVLGNQHITDIEIMQAANDIGIEEFIDGLPQGLDYNVQERGGVLSAGQRQLLAFLRAYITDPQVLILDEATSSIDSHTEELIQRALIALTQDRTSVIIAHRLSTIQHADKIVVLDKGVVVETGGHQALLKSKGAYYRLYEKQFAAEV